MIFEHDLLVSFSGHGPEEIVTSLGRMCADLLEQPRLLCGVIDVILRIEGIDVPVFTVIVISGSYFYLHDDVPLLC